MSNQCTCTLRATKMGTLREGELCNTCKGEAALASPRGRLAARLLEARLHAKYDRPMPSPEHFASNAVKRADALIKELLKQ